MIHDDTAAVWTVENASSFHVYTGLGQTHSTIQWLVEAR